MILWMVFGCATEVESVSKIEEEEQEDAFVEQTDFYRFTNAEGISSVSYSGQICRHLLIHDITEYISALDQRVREDLLVSGSVENDLDFYVSSVSDVGELVPHSFRVDIAVEQETYGDVSAGKNLQEKLAGNDAVTDHKDWTADFVGWDAEQINSPQVLLESWFQTLDQQATNWVGLPETVLGTAIEHVYITPEGHDLQMLIETFTQGAVAFSQATDDYLDDDIEGKGLLSSHFPEEGKSYSPLEHAWDEAFGYFGAVRDYGMWSDDDIVEVVYNDTDSSGAIDLLSEVNWGYSVQAANRDRSVEGLDFSREIWESFLDGRSLLAKTVGQELTSEQFSELQGYRDRVVLAWEKTVAATVVHNINALHQELQRFENEQFDFTVAAKHWSASKGFALSFQFNPRSQLSASDFQRLHELIGMQIDFNDLEQYRERLEESKQIIGEAFGFDAEQIGDSNGEFGW